MRVAMQLESLTVILVPKKGAGKTINFISTISEKVQVVVVDSSSKVISTLVLSSRRKNMIALHYTGSMVEKLQLAALASNTDWFLFTDPDMEFSPTFFDTLIQIENRVAFGQVVPVFDAFRGKEALEKTSRWLSSKGIYPYSGLQLLIHRDLFWAAGGFDLREKKLAVLELIWRLRDHGTVVGCDSRLGGKRKLQNETAFLQWTALLLSIFEVCTLYLRHLPRFFFRREWGSWVKDQPPSLPGDDPMNVEEKLMNGN